MTDREQLKTAIAALEAQRALLGDAVVDLAATPLREKLAVLADGADAGVAPLPAPQALKQVSVLFLDVVGSTAIGHRLDPEDIQAVMDGALEALTAIVLTHGGRVLQYAGDNLLAVFGADEAQEDDAERGVRCGLALLAGTQALAQAVQARHGIGGFDVRVGIHTGPVLLGGGVDAGHSIRGSTVNIAARMEQSAPAGGLRISHATYAQVRGVFDVAPQPPIDVKGIDEPMLTYFVLRAKPRAFRVATRGIEGVATRMVGRASELARLQDAFKRLYSAGKLAVVTVVADAGIGKSRLLYEFQNWAEARPEAFYLFRGRADPQTRSQPYGLLRDILAWRLQIADDDSMQAARQKVEQGIAPLFAADDGDAMAQAHAHLLGHLIGLDFSDSPHVRGIKDDAKQIRSRGFHVAAQMLRRVAAQGGAPIVLLLDDLHWADDDSLDFLSHLTQVNRDVPMLMLGLTRPELFERRADWAARAVGAEWVAGDPGDGPQRIDLGPLDKGLSRALADELLQRLPEVPAALRELVTGGAEGNPFYMEELVKMLVDEGAIVTSADQWSVNPDKLLAANLPQTLTGVLQARLDALMPAEKLALQQASVIGFVFWDQALAAIDPRAPDAMPRVTQRAMVVAHQDAGFEGVREYAFSHQVLHHATYDTVLKRLRRDYHAKAGAWLAGLSGARANDFLGLAAEHFEQAGDAPNACEYFARAATHAAGRYAHEAVLGYAGRALALSGADESAESLLMRWRLLDVRERTLDLQGRRKEQQADIDALHGLAEALDDDTRRAEVAWRRSDIALRTADFHTMESAARQAMALAERAGAVALGLRAQQRLAVALATLGDTAAGRAIAQSSLAAARALGLRSAEALALSALAVVANEQEDWMGSLEALQQKLRVERELGNRRSICTTLVNLGAAWLELGEQSQARRHLEEGLRLARAVGDRATECYPLLSLAVLALRQGDAASARAHAQSALGIAVAMHDSLIEANALCRLGDAELALGRHDAAAAAFERAHATAVALKHVRQYDAAAGLARVALARGELPQSLAPVQALIDHLAAGGTLLGTDSRPIRLTCHLALARVGDPRAAEVLADAYAELQTRAAGITDAALRDSFLNEVSEHRRIIAAWAARRPPGSPAAAQ